jgi:hypothetical protein
VKAVKNVIIALIALAVMYWLWESYIRPGAVDIAIVTRDVGRVVTCRYCGKVIEEQPNLIRVPANEASRYHREQVRSVCAECGAQMSK